MQVNCTLFVQMLNFAIAYLLLRYLFFKPALAILHNHEQKILLARNQLKTYELELIAQQQEAEAAWNECRSHFKETRPLRIGIKSLLSSGITPVFDPVLASQHSCLQKQQELEQHIIKKVLHDRA